MPKLKTKKAFLKRFKITRTGKILRRATGLNHYRSKKKGGAVRKGRKWVSVSDVEVRRIKRALRI
jgi:ribosomal protein L35